MYRYCNRPPPNKHLATDEELVGMFFDMTTEEEKQVLLLILYTLACNKCARSYLYWFCSKQSEVRVYMLVMVELDASSCACFGFPAVYDTLSYVPAS
jgi:hypothetical protein